MVKEFSELIRNYFKLVKFKKSTYCGLCFFVVLYTVVTLLIPVLSSKIIEYLTIADQYNSILYIILFSVIYLLSRVILYFKYSLYSKNYSYSYNNLTVKALNKLLLIDNNFSKNISAGKLFNAINNDIITLADINDRIPRLFMAIIQIVTIIVIVSYINIVLGLIFIVFTLIYILMKNFYDKKNNYYYNKVLHQEDKYTTLLTEVIPGLQEIKTYNMLPKITSKLKVLHNRFIKLYKSQSHYLIKRDVDSLLVKYVVRFFLYMILIYLMSTGKIGIDILVLIIAYHVTLVGYISELTTSTVLIREAGVSINRLNDILNYKVKAILYGDYSIKNSYQIEFKNVSYDVTNKKVLKNLNFTINENEVVVITGANNSGKTSIFNLLLRINEVSIGVIKIDNKNIKEYKEETYKSLVSVVNQKPFIFNMSIRKNLNLVDTNITNQINACKLVGIHEVIEKLPRGYNTILRENASNISDGQKQLISLARTILTESEIILLDDVTSSLDQVTFKSIPLLINKLKEEHTIIIITQKSELMKIADKIIVMNEGKIDEIGTHNELIKNNEIYKFLQLKKSPSRIGVFENDK